MKPWPWLEAAIAAILEAAAKINKESNLADILELAIQMECVEMNIMTSGMELPDNFSHETKRIRSLQKELT